MACARAACKAAFISSIEANRSSGFLAVDFRMTRSTESGTVGLTSLGRGRDSFRCFIRTPIGVSASKGRAPVLI
jgi:hypothetical protein